MALLDRGVVRWDGFPGGPGFTVMYATPGASFMAAIRTFFVNTALYYPGSCVFSFPSSGDTIESTTGALSGSWSGATLANVSGSGSGSYAAPAGVSITWNTNTIVPAGSSSLHAHRMRGRTFLVPLQTGTYDNNGTILDSAYAVFQTHAANLITAGGSHFHIWHRPAAGASDGLSGEVLSATIRDKVSILRSRRT